MASRKLRKKIRKWVFLITLVALLCYCGWVLVQWINYREAKFTRYPAFGISIPSGYEIHGIDVSRYQHLIAWEEVKAMEVLDVKLGFAFIKATEGIGNRDPQFVRNWRQTRHHSMVRGAYHFFIASKDGKLQAENFIRRVELETGDLPPVLDVEQTNGVSKAQLQREVKEWLAVAEAYYKVKPILYTNVDFYNRYLGKDFDEYPLWIAHYYERKQPRISRSWSFWQYSDVGNVNGIRAKVDFNVFRGDSADFRSLLMP